MIPILDLKPQYEALKRDIDSAVLDVLSGGTFIMGPNVNAFEQEIAAYLGAKHAISLNSGTDALYLALRALDIGPSHEVITTPFTFAATAEAIGMVGATPVFVDIDPETFNIDTRLISAAITPLTKAVLPVHLYGAAADVAAILEVTRNHGIAVIEDCAQAIGAELNGRKVGTIGDIGCFSFFPTKNLGAYGDGGLVTTNDPVLADRLSILRKHGAHKKYYHEELGVNSRLDEVQAAILRVKLPYLDSWNTLRRRIAADYTKRLQGLRLKTPKSLDHNGHVYHQYTIRLDDRDTVCRRLLERGIQSMVYYPVPLNKQAVYGARFAGQAFPEAERAALEVLSLPIYPELTNSMQDEIVTSLRLSIGVGTAA